MFEIFLFINPIGIYCYEIEKRIQKAIKDLDLDVCYHFVPVATVGTVQEDLIRRRRNSQQLCDLSYFTLATNHALEDYHAIKLAYGNKRARKFLFALQQYLNEDGTTFSCQLVEKIYQEIGLNKATIQEFKSSEYIRDSIDQDQKLANQWQIKKTPTIIIFNEEKESDSGVLLEGLVSQNDLYKLLTPDNEHDDEYSNNLVTANHLRLV